MKNISSRISVQSAQVSDQRAWQDYVQAHEKSTLYHDFRWRELLSHSFGHPYEYLMASENNKIVGILPLILFKSCFMPSALVSLPYLNYAGILADSREVEAALLEKAKEIMRREKVSYIELRQVRPLEIPVMPHQHKVTMILDLLSKPEDQWGALDKKIRNQVRKAEKSGFQVRFGQDNILNDFYRVFRANMRDLGTPVLARKFFSSILAEFSKESLIAVVYEQGKPVSAGFTLQHDLTMEIPWASSLRKYNPLCANVFLYWQLIQKAIELRCRKFDFGRCTKGSGTYHFKKQWGAQEHQLYWQYAAGNKMDIPAESPSGKFNIASQIWRYLPVSVTNAIGPIVARHITRY